jgi:hypothetical protein
MVFFNAIYQTYSQDHKTIIQIGLTLYTAILAGIYSQNILDSGVGQLVKKYGWMLIVIDYVVLVLLHYMQTGKYLFKSAIIKNVPHYKAWDVDQIRDLPEKPNLLEESVNKPTTVPNKSESSKSKHNDSNLSKENQQSEKTILCDADGTCHLVPKEAPFDLDYALDNEIAVDEQEYFVTDGETKVVDNYALNHQNLDDLSETISE